MLMVPLDAQGFLSSILHPSICLSIYPHVQPGDCMQEEEGPPKEVTAPASKVWCCLVDRMVLTRSVWALGDGDMENRDEAKVRKEGGGKENGVWVT